MRTHNRQEFRLDARWLSAVAALGVLMIPVLLGSAVAAESGGKPGGLTVPFRGEVTALLQRGDRVLIEVTLAGDGVAWVLAPSMGVRLGQGLEIDAATVYHQAYDPSSGLRFDRIAVPTHGVLQGQDIRISDSQLLPESWAAVGPG